MNDSRAGHVISFIDACNSGTFSVGKGELLFPYGELGGMQRKFNENKIIFTSARGKQRSFENEEWKKGVFTYFLVKGLLGDAKEIDYPNFVNIKELYRYVHDSVLEYTDSHSAMQAQEPMIIETTGRLEEDLPVSIRTRHSVDGLSESN